MKSSQRFMGLLLSVLLSGVPAIWAQSQAQATPLSESTTKPADLPDSPSYAQAQSQKTTLAQATQPQESQSPQTQPAESQATSQPATSQAPQSQSPDSQPATSQPPQTQAPDPQPAAQQQSQPADQNPAGAATAQRGKTAGGAASRPAGAALAPAKQRNSRSLLIKLGLLAGAGVALGTAFALSQASPSRPPGAH